LFTSEDELLIKGRKGSPNEDVTEFLVVVVGGDIGDCDPDMEEIRQRYVSVYTSTIINSTVL
jgi:hypothetical protein